ncbi:MAG: RlmE family RNA methyltransferase [Archaeoglobi archaeon]|nr:RlmE family RNA methyltransferase [Candidatus Mnemosynella sp.]
MRWRRDYYYRKAKKEGYRSRASYKLKQINERFGVIGESDDVLDLGCAPGGWLQVARELTQGKVVGIDLQEVEPIEGVLTIKGDIRDERCIEEIRKYVHEFDVILSDASPNLSGNWSYDHARSIDLALSALKIAENLLKPGGKMVMKVFQGELFEEFMREFRSRFRKVWLHSPKASRKRSAEIYVIGKGFRK